MEGKEGGGWQVEEGQGKEGKEKEKSGNWFLVFFYTPVSHRPRDPPWS